MLTTQEVRVDYFILSETKLAHFLTTAGGFLPAAKWRVAAATLCYLIIHA
jgi:hypothetical protein